MAKVDGVRVVREHCKECGSIQPQNHPDNPLWMPAAWGSDGTMQADRIGRALRRGCMGYQWILFRCSSTECHAEIWLREDVLTKLAHELMQEAQNANR